MNSTVREQLHKFLHGTNLEVQALLGAHFAVKRGKHGVIFRTWAPNAHSVSVVGDFNAWDRRKASMKKHEESGVWEAFIPDIKAQSLYKYSIADKLGQIKLKADPCALQYELPPADASKIAEAPAFRWGDKRWMQNRAGKNLAHSPVNIYEVHLGSWRKNTGGSPMTYSQIAPLLADYCVEMGYTHIELLPIAEYPQDESLGYQATGFFAPTSRYGTPKELMQFVNTLHKAGIGVILDWTPAHFPKDEHGLVEYDGTPCYEYADPLKQEHTRWGTRVFDYAKPQVQSFLFSSALHWIEAFHMDGLRIDSAAAMLYLDYDREAWAPNALGGRENLEAVEFLRALNTNILTRQPDIMMMAEAPASFPMVTKPPYAGGLGFHYTWNINWMGDTLDYVALDPWYRTYNHDKLTFGIFYAFNENFILPFSHNQAAGKQSLIESMPGAYRQKFAGVRAFLGYMMSYPGKKLLFMGNEFGQFSQWDPAKELDWMLLDYEAHRQLRDYIKALNHFYSEQPALWQVEDSQDGFQWIVPDDNSQNIVVFRRMDEKDNELVVAVNFAPVARSEYRFGVKRAQSYGVVFCSQDACFGGDGQQYPDEIPSEPIPLHGQQHSISLTIPPMSAIWIAPNGPKSNSLRMVKTAKKK